ncbi:hypothetical protein CWE22_07450 [Pseudidiomarina aestuarii]|uniref:Peptidase M61 catalytic domain-containing protein n=1 Tax=Pseudidiomarina aestuarii TaxID=624146 RepID=A0A7Z6ZV43_9GAMM|nr:M1 family aminopeptidase [Pseudidiomarina aestuarii]RUO41969.1 hypothetical protein CWE22_07450 [Pseudidiomarina aestuarii]
MRYFFVWFLLTASSFAAATTHQQHLELQIGTEPHSGSALVNITFQGDADGTTELEFSRWAGLENLSDHLRGVQASYLDGSIIELNQDGDDGWLVDHDPNATISFQYQIASNSLQREGEGQAYFRPLVSAEMIHLIGHSALLLPSHYKQDFSLKFTWLPHSHTAAFNSFVGANDFKKDSVSMSELRGALFVMGDIQIEQREVAGQPLYITLQRRPDEGLDWNFNIALLADLAASITQAERDFFGDYDFPFYWVSAISAGQAMSEGYMFSGTLLHNNFALFLNPSTIFELNEPNGSPIVNLLAHEMMHVWIGSRISPELSTPVGELAWFTEGFTNYLTNKVLVHAEILSQEQYVTVMNEAFTALIENPAKNASNEDIAEKFWSDFDHQMLPYQRGHLVAFYLDHSLRSTNLESLIKTWLADGTWNQAFTLERFLASVKPHLAPANLEQLKNFIEQGSLPSWTSLQTSCFKPDGEKKLIQSAQENCF